MNTTCTWEQKVEYLNTPNWLFWVLCVWVDYKELKKLFIFVALQVFHGEKLSMKWIHSMWKRVLWDLKVSCCWLIHILQWQIVLSGCKAINHFDGLTIRLKCGLIIFCMNITFILCNLYYFTAESIFYRKLVHEN